MGRENNETFEIDHCGLRPLCAYPGAGFFPAGHRRPLPDYRGHRCGKDHHFRCHYLCPLWRGQRRQPGAFHAALQIRFGRCPHLCGTDLPPQGQHLYRKAHSRLYPCQKPGHRPDRPGGHRRASLPGRTQRHQAEGRKPGNPGYHWPEPGAILPDCHDLPGRFPEAATGRYRRTAKDFPGHFQDRLLCAAAKQAKGQGRRGGAGDKRCRPQYPAICAGDCL